MDEIIQHRLLGYLSHLRLLKCDNSFKKKLMLTNTQKQNLAPEHDKNETVVSDIIKISEIQRHITCKLVNTNKPIIVCYVQKFYKLQDCSCFFFFDYSLIQNNEKKFYSNQMIILQIKLSMLSSSNFLKKKQEKSQKCKKQK